MNEKTRIITEHPYSPIFIETLGQYYYIRYLSQWFNAETIPILKYRVMPPWMFPIYRFIAANESMFYFRVSSKDRHRCFRNIFWLTQRTPLLWKGKMAEMIDSTNLGKIIFSFSDDPSIQIKYTGQPWPAKKERDFQKGLKKLLAISTSIWMHENRIKDYRERGFEISDPLVLPCASDPELFKATPLPKEKVIGFIASVIGDKKIYQIRNLPLLINACRIVQKTHPDIKLLLCGRMQPDIKQLLVRETKGLNAEIISEWIPYYQVHKMYERAYMIVRSRKKIEILDKLSGSSQQAFDAAATGRPFISTGIRDNMPEDLNIIVCDYTPEDMAEKMLKLLDDRKYAEKIGKYNRSRIEKKHSWEHRAKELYDHIKDRI